MSDKSISKEDLQLKLCSNENGAKGCGKLLPLDDFSKLKKGKFGRHPYCKNCRSEHRKKLNYPRKTEGLKYCSGENCQKEKSVVEFDSQKSSLDGLQTYCKACRHLMSKEWASTLDGFLTKIFHDVKSNSKKKINKVNIEITFDDIKELYIKQKGKCAITGKQMTYLDSQDKGNYNVSISRIDPNKDYTKNNIQLIGAIINRRKRDLDENEFLLICDDIVKSNFNKINKLRIESIKKSACGK